ncbi:hypothetical protein EB834_20265, partial [Brevibacterium aurantiacum]
DIFRSERKLYNPTLLIRGISRLPRHSVRNKVVYSRQRNKHRSRIASGEARRAATRQRIMEAISNGHS